MPVRALVRRPERAGLPGGVEVVRGDLSDLDSLGTALRGVDSVFLMWPLPTGDPAPAVAVEALTSDGHAGARYDLTGPQALTQIEQVRVIGEVIGRPTRWEEVPPEVAREQLLTWMPARYADAMLGAYASLADAAPDQPTKTVEEVTGKPARTFSQWVADHAAEFGVDHC